VKLRHATLASRVASIRRSGLLTAKSRGKRPVIWLHAGPSRTAWAILHTAKRHQADVRDVVVLTVSAPRSWLRRSQRGLWFCVRDLSPGRLAGEVIDFAAVSRSPVQD
jgi:hypothetical protein